MLPVFSKFKPVYKSPRWLSTLKSINFMSILCCASYKVINLRQVGAAHTSSKYPSGGLRTEEVSCLPIMKLGMKMRSLARVIRADTPHQGNSVTQHCIARYKWHDSNENTTLYTHPF